MNSLLDTQDDCIAIKSGRDEDGRRVGIPSKNIRISNCVFIDTFSIGTIKEPCGRGALIDNIVYRNCSLENISLEYQDCKWFRGALMIDQFYSHDSFDIEKEEIVSETTPSIKNIQFENITVDTLATTVVYLVGLPEMPLQNITL